MEKGEFHGKLCYFLSDEAILLNMNALWNHKGKDFPGPQPISIERKHIPELSKQDYFVSDKSDGIRSALVFITHDDKPYCVMVDRKLKMTLVQCNAPAEVYKGTIVDGEILVQNNAVLFLAYDCVSVSGKDISTHTFLGRMKMANELSSVIRSEYFKYKVKTFYKYEDISKCLEDAKLLQYKTDGLIFVPDSCNVKVGTNDKMYKWKEQYDNTVDFAIEGSDQNILYLQKSGELVKTINKLVSPVNYSPSQGNRIVECKCVSIEKRLWSVINERTDKSLPNSLYTFRKTLLNIKENIFVTEFIKY